MNNPTTLVDPTGLASDCTANEDNTVTCAIGDSVTVYGGEPPNIPTIGCWNLDRYGCSYNGPNYAYAGGTGTGSGGGGGGGGGSTTPPTKPPSTLSKVASAVCSAIPQGRTEGFGGSVGAVGGQTGTAEVLINYNTGQASAFLSGGIQVGWNGGAQASAFTGFVYGLGKSNSNYSGGFTTVAVSPAVIGGYVSASSGGLTGNPLQLTNGPRVVGVSASVNLLGTPTATVSATNYSRPLNLGNFLTYSNPIDLGLYLARQVCQ